MERDFSIGDFFGFEKLIATKVLKFVYFFGLAGIALFALVSFFGAFTIMRYSFASGLGTMLLTVIGSAFGALMWRIVIEIYMVFFGIYDRLGDIRAALTKQD